MGAKDQKPGFPWPVGWPEVLPRQTNGDPLYVGFDPAAPGSDRSVGYCVDCGEYVELPHECREDL